MSIWILITVTALLGIGSLYFGYLANVTDNIGELATCTLVAIVLALLTLGFGIWTYIVK